MLAVLPFENLSGDPEQDYFADGLTEEMISQLGQLNPESLAVIARTSAMKYKGTRKGVAEIGRELGVQYLLEGSVRREGERFRVTAQLVRTHDQTQTWSASFDRPQGDLLALQSEMARAVSHDIQIHMTSQYEARLAARRPVHPEVYHLYLKGRYFWNKRTGEGIETAIRYFEQALQKDPSFALAHAGLADCYVLLTFFRSVPSRDSFPMAKEEALKALELDPTLGEAYATLGYARYNYDWDWGRAEADFRRALELNSGYATAHHWYSNFLRMMGRHDEALVQEKLALELDPLNLMISAEQGLPYLYAGRYDEAIREFHKALALDANFLSTHIFLAVALVQKGHYQEAIEHLERAREIESVPASLANLGYAYAVAGRKQDAEKLLRQLEEQSQRGYVAPWVMAIIQTGLGRKAEAIRSLEKAYQERSWALVAIKAEPFFHPLRSEAGYQDLLRRMKFPE